MQVKQISEHVWSAHIWFIYYFHVWFVVDEHEGVTLIDAGMKNMSNGILKALKQIDAGPLQRIILTHGHPDHVGSIPTILEHYDVPVYAHSLEIPYTEGHMPYPTKKTPTVMLPRGIAQPLPVEPDGQLSKIGGVTPYFTPGHSPGHVVYYHEEDEVMIAGDLFTSKGGKLNRPMPYFTPDMEEAFRSSLIIDQLKPKYLQVCHGKPVLDPASHLIEYRKKEAAKYSFSM